MNQEKMKKRRKRPEIFLNTGERKRTNKPSDQGKRVSCRDARFFCTIWEEIGIMSGKIAGGGYGVS